MLVNITEKNIQIVRPLKGKRSFESDIIEKAIAEFTKNVKD
jgi:hypothetical protein